jgi:hypothetical protein
MKTNKKRINGMTAQMFWGPSNLPKNAKFCGVVQRKTGDSGALIVLQNGIFVQGNAGIIRTLDQRKVSKSL